MIRMAGKAALTAVATAALVAAGVGATYAAAIPITGNVSCNLVTAILTVKPGVPLTAEGELVKDFSTKVKLTGTLTGCTGTNDSGDLGIHKGAITAASIKGIAKVISPAGGPPPSCGMFLNGETGNITLPDIVAQVKWLGNGTCKKDKNACVNDADCDGGVTSNAGGDICKYKPVGKTFIQLTAGDVSGSEGPPITADLTNAPVTKKDFFPGLADVHLELSETINSLTSACNTPVVGLSQITIGACSSCVGGTNAGDVCKVPQDCDSASCTGSYNCVSTLTVTSTP
jgi:hypothetical protein